MSILGFWGLHVLPGKTYTQVVDASFRVSMASFGEEIKSQERTCVKVNVDDKEFVLCALTPKHIEQQLLDHNFVEGEEVTFSVSGKNAVHLTGNYIPDDDMDQDPYDSDLMMGSSDEEDDLEEASEDDEEDDDILANGIVTNGAKRLAAVEESDEEEEEEEEEVPVAKNGKKRAAEQAAAPATKKQKAQEQAKKQESKKPEPKKPEAKKEQAKKEEPKKEQPKKEEAKKEKPKATKLANGLVIEDMKVGTGPKAKAGQRIGMRYIGKLQSGKVFDKNVSGKPFNFGLGRGEVIKGWDQGIVGMAIGGERRLTIPASLAYGSQSLPGIPKNSTLIFDVKLLTMK
ncbi:hypothetical protein K450DRAFT_232325 [Umbelopsis ramanniana AG]|uniref:peptidylprolyl isomerase n=1 Tax=Umbelopsis ramanniana AG TaxID=1314678 RepID=A0AAD5ED63_UMBRA|nr:uncharacterized protein K450DRAFT_232325 [Umbelopsis ramanniana AG]KAI8581289.1 hypothetical protein K450DRAFT_232325 [Umbelopsis ramanniana AG]